MTNSLEARLHHVRRFYALLDDLSSAIGGMRTLADCNGRTRWPERGVYFFFEAGEARSSSGNGLRVVRVGTHALKLGAQTTLWRRLSQHKGSESSGGGNHRGSIFRLIVGDALLGRQGATSPTWGRGSSAPKDVTASEVELERAVSKVIGRMPFLYLPVDDPAGPDSQRGTIERNAIALLSNDAREPIDPASRHWLGHSCRRGRARACGLWNSDHVNDDFDPRSLDVMATLVANARRYQ